MKRSSVLSGLALAVLVACSGETDTSGSAPVDGGLTAGDEPPELDPCGGPDHPCTLAEVNPEAQARTDKLADLLLDRLQSPDDLEDAAGWLLAQDGVVSVATGPEAVRFRVRGGRGHWIFVQTLGTVGKLSAPTIPKPPRRPAAEHPPASEAGMALIAPAAAPPPALSALQGTTKGQRKRALLLSPFRWQWEVGGGNDGIEDIAKALRARDYVDGVTVWTERLDPENPSQTIGEIGLAAFTTWRQYDYVHLLTHGGRACNKMGYCMTVVMAPWTLEQVTRARAGTEAAGNDDLTLLLDRVGVETAKVRLWVTKDRIPFVGPGQKSDEAIPLTERDKPEGQQRVATVTGPFIVLTSQFFKDTYPGGLDDAVIVISACSSGAYNDLLGALQGENTAVIGWNSTMSLEAAAAGGTLIAQTLVEVDETIEDDSGLTVSQAMDKIRGRLDELARDPPDWRACANPSSPEVQATCDLASKAKVLSVINDQPADLVTGATLEVRGNTSIRAREIVYLVDQAGGEDLTEGSVLDVVGAAGDGIADLVELWIRVDGLGLEDDPKAMDLQVVFEGREIDLDRGLEVEVAPGVWELAYRLPLGRDHQSGERVTMEVVAVLPDGGDSRWEYRDLVLACSVPSQGDYDGTLGGERARVVEARSRGAFAKILPSPLGGWALQMESRERGGRDLNMLLSFDELPEAGTSVRIEDASWTDAQIGGGVDRFDRERQVSWNMGSIDILFTVVRDRPGKPFKWVCGEVSGELIGFQEPPPGATQPVRVTGTFQGSFRAEWFPR